MRTISLVRRQLRGISFGLALTAILGSAASASAGFDLEMHAYCNASNFYSFYTPLTTNAIGANPAFGYYTVLSPQQPTNGSYRQFLYTGTNGLELLGGAENVYPDFVSVVKAITNGQWRILYTNSVTTNLYRFSVSAAGFVSSNLLPVTTMTFPAPGATNVTNWPTITWEGPTNWNSGSYIFLYNNDFSYFQYAEFPPSQTSWMPPVWLPYTNSFQVQLSYLTNVPGLFTASTPLSTNLSQPIGGWSSSSVLESATFPTFSTGPPSLKGTAHLLAAYYSFEDNNLFAHDFAENGNDLTYASFGSPPFISTDARAGSHAGGFGGSGWFVGGTNLVNALAGSFTVSVWLKTSDASGNDYDAEYAARGVVSANEFDNAVMPIGITGHKAAFFTSGDSYELLHSKADVTTGSYVHVVVTRNQASGEKRLYVNGVFDSFSFGATNFLNGGDEVDFGYNQGQAFNGVVDEIQLYQGVLSQAEITQLYNHPGTTMPDILTGGYGPLAHYDFDEGSSLAADVSGHTNDLVYEGTFGGAGPQLNADSKNGTGSVEFDGYSYLSAPAALLPALAKSFSISLWLKTTDTTGEAGFPASYGAGIVAADVPDVNNDSIPIALTGGQVAFNIGDTNNEIDDTLNSNGAVNDGEWHHVVVTREKTTGEKRIYIDGSLDVSEFGTTNSLLAPRLITIGALADASDSNPSSPDSSGYNGYTGLLDDIQFYNHALSADDVQFLYYHPGAEINVTTSSFPATVSLLLQVFRSQDADIGDEYFAFPSFAGVNPPPNNSTNTVRSPNGHFGGHEEQNDGGSFSTILHSFDELRDAITNGEWQITLNSGSPTQQVYSFHVAAAGFVSNTLPRVQIFSPAQGATNVPPNPNYYWAGPSNFASLFVDLLNVGSPFVLPIETTNWPDAPPLPPGLNDLNVNYTSNGYNGLVFSTPLDSFQNPIHAWISQVDMVTIGVSTFTVVNNLPTAVRLANLRATGNNVTFSFQTESGHSHIIESRTNLVLGAWTTLTNVTGDGTLQQFSFPMTNGPMRFFRVGSQ